MIQEISSYCSPSQINDCVTDAIAILSKTDWAENIYFNSIIQETARDNDKLALTIGTVRSSKFALILEEADNTRDRLLTGLTQITKACMLRENKDSSESATEVYRAIKAHGLNLKHQGYQSESAGIDSLVSELNSDKMKALVDALPECKAFLMELISANEKFKSKFDENMAYKADIEKLKSPSIQKKVVRQLFNNKVVNYLNMMSEIDSATFGPIAKSIAPYTEKINLAAKISRGKKEQETNVAPEAN